MELDHDYKKLIGVLSRALGSSLAGYEYKDEALHIYLVFGLSKEEVTITKALVRSMVDRHTVSYSSRNLVLSVRRLGRGNRKRDLRR